MPVYLFYDKCDQMELEIVTIKNGQINRIWTPELKSEIVYKHLDEHISVLTPERECAVDGSMTMSKLANESCMILEGFAGTDSSKYLYLKC